MNTETKYQKIVQPIIFFVAVIIIAIGRLDTAFNTGMYDAQLFDYFGQRLNEGDKLYVDIWDIKPPGIFLINQILNIYSINNFYFHSFFEFVFLSSCIYPVYKISQKYNNTSLSIISVLIFSGFTTLARFNEGGNLTEIYVLSFSSWSLYFYITSDRYYRLIICGLLVGTSIFFKLNGISILFLIIIYGAIKSFVFKNFYEFIYELACILLGLFLFWFFVFLFYSDQFMTLFEVCFIYPFSYSASSVTSIFDIYHKLMHRIDGLKVIFIFYAAGFVIAMKCLVQASKYHDTSALFFILIFGWAASDALGVLAGGRLYGHYFMLCFSSFSVLVAYILNQCRGAPIVFYAFSFASGLLICLMLLEGFADARAALSAGRYQEDNLIVSVLKKAPKKGASLYVVPYKPYYYSVSNLPAASRFTTTVNLRDTKENESEIGNQILTDLSDHMPDYIVVDQTKRYPHKFEQGLNALIDKCYLPVQSHYSDLLYGLIPNCGK
jgi:hypothetical protein